MLTSFVVWYRLGHIALLVPRVGVCMFGFAFGLVDPIHGVVAGRGSVPSLRCCSRTRGAVCAGISDYPVASCVLFCLTVYQFAPGKFGESIFPFSRRKHASREHIPVDRTLSRGVAQ